nr:uncharacterized protein LOC131795796 [Pocillopora verrucosa]
MINDLKVDVPMWKYVDDTTISQTIPRGSLGLVYLVDFYCTTIRSVLEYCAPLFHHALPAYLSEDIERIQKRVLSIILPDMSYQDCLDRLGLPTLKERRNDLCKRLFDSIANNSGHKLHNLLPPRNEQSYCLRHQRTYSLPRSRTDRFRQSFVYAMSKDA